MKKIPIHPNMTKLTSALAITAASMIGSVASPYATSLTNDAGVISFRLNQTNTQVQVIYNGGASVTNLGSLPAGLTVTNLGITGAFSVRVTGSAPAGYVQTSDDTANINRFNNPRGIAVNKRPASPYFGRIYVANTSGGVAGARTTTQGIYLLNADGTDAVGQGDAALTGGYALFGQLPWKISIGQDDNMYGCGRDATLAGVFVADPNITTFTNALFGTTATYPCTNFHGSINGVWVEGSQAGGDLKMYVNDEDYEENPPERNSLWRYDIGGSPFPYHTNDNSTPITHIFNTQINAGNQAFNDVVRGGVSNYFYVMQVSVEGYQPGIYVVDASGNEISSSLSATTNLTGNPAHLDIMKTCQALDISWDGKYLILLRGTVSGVAQPAELITLATDGTLDLSITNSLIVAPTGQQNAAQRDVSIDAAGNLYCANSATAGKVMRVFARGGYTVATTGSDGSYTFAEPTTITSSTLINSGTQVQIDFTGPITAGAWYYKLQSSSTINGTYTDTGDTVTRLSSGVFQVITSVSPGGNQFFKIHQP
jgi:hypothetical protein